MKCSFCHSELVSEARICKSCGHPVYRDPSLEDLYFSRLAAIAPPNFIQKVRSAPYLAKERRMVTAILFTIDNVNAFNLAIPENERNTILNKALDRFASHIFSYEGTIAKLWQDSVLAFFGAPISHEDDTFRAVHAALAILDEVQKVRKETQNTYGFPLQLKMVLNAGPIVIGDIKSNLRFDFRSLDNTLECMDAALRTPLPTCEVILLEDAYRFAKTYIEFEKLEDRYCEEIDSTMQFWRVVHITDRFQNGSRMSASREIKFIGRERELDSLMELTETVLAGLGRIGLVLGDPGIGKSRLITEWKNKLRRLHQPTQIRWIEAHSQAFGRELAYHLLKDLLRSALNLPVIVSQEALKVNLMHTLGDSLDSDVQKHYQYLAHLLEIPISDEEEEQIHQLSATQLRIQYLNSIRSFLRNLSIEQPLVIILEDLQWADASSIQLLGDLFSMTATSPILFCLVSRHDIGSNGWQLVMKAQEGFGPRLTKIELANLTESQSQELMGEWINIDQIPASIRSMVLTKSEGNPYFIEELMDMLDNENTLVNVDNPWVEAPKINPNKIPDSLQGLLTARIDRLPPDARFTLKIASIIGRNFPEQILEHVIANRAPKIELMEQLSTLESIGMIKVARIHPELTYQFQHILMHEAAYNAILESDRSDLHMSVGLALEELYPDQKERLASQLALHFLEGGDPDKAFAYLDSAGHVAMDSYANAEAESYFIQAIQLAKDPENFAHLYTDLGEALAQQGKHRDAIQMWKQAIQYHKELNNTDRLARVYAWSARSAWWGYDPKRSLEICKEGLKAVEGAVESPDIAYLIHETGRAYLFNDQPDKAQAFSEKALELARRLEAFDVQAEALATIGILPNIKPEKAIAALEMAVSISEEHNLFGPASRAYINLAAVMDNLGEVKLARDYQKRAIQLGNKAGGVSDERLIQHSIAIASLWLADFGEVQALIDQIRQTTLGNEVYLDSHTLDRLFLEGQLARLKGDFSTAMEIFTDLIDRTRQTHDQDRILQANSALAEVVFEPQLLEEKASKANIDIALSMLNDGLESSSNGNTPIDISTDCLLSGIYAIQEKFAEAEKAFEMAQTGYRLHPVMQDRVKLILAKARLEAAHNHYQKAIASMNDAVELIEKMNGRWWRARIWLEMGIYHLKRNEPEDIDQAQNLFRESLAEFKDMGVSYYPDLIINKLRHVRRISRDQAIAHRKITQELAEAGRVQHTFIPTHSPKIKGYDISGVLLPAHETSGDFYDFIDLDHGNLGIVIADVGDKGAGAALYMAMSRTLIRTYAGEHHLDPAEVINNVNRRILSDTQRGIFLTVVFGILDPQEATFVYVNAGHNPPYLLKNSEQGIQIDTLEKTGALVGIFPENTWEIRTLKLKPGEVLVLYTDGISEAQNEDGDFYGTERLIKVLETCFTPSAEEYRNAILEDVQAFTGSAPRLDDITLIVIAREK